MIAQPRPGAALAAATTALAGVPFRLHGRDPAHGLDCIGLLEAALSATGRAVTLPCAYALRNTDISGLIPAPASFGFGAVNGPVQPGDVVMTRPGPAQFHLAIATADGTFVHAHAGLRRVVIQPGPLPGPQLAHWRLLLPA
jgi:cell wall-associated NlpC family hydrolase